MVRTLFVLVSTVLIAYGARPATAQDDPVMPRETEAIFAHIDDLDKLRLLNPLNLTAGQLDKIIPLIKERQKAYNRRIIELAVEPLKAVANQIADTRRKLLSGGSIPQELDDRIKQLQKDFADRRKVEQDKNLKLVSDGIRAVLTERQIREIVAMARRDFRTADGTDAQFFNLWIRETIIVYDRIVPLLEEMRKARNAPSTSS